ncbi:hypothetical protein PHYBOEH_006719 [Phytophthora boehmeriae]|uniref:Myb-like domain-containing protein n=1 Tax=Phytophthora boehmeriae TaxID=109152 RepID=A0A8T1X9T6_9STRA|nr:hypothetical protein PHYBOEH_006719 [Phytophthora boehmeriae]
MPTSSRSPSTRSNDAVLKVRSRTRYSSVLESALVGLGRADAVVQSTRKPRKKRHFPALDAENSPISSFPEATRSSKRLSLIADEDKDPFAQLKLRRTHRNSSKKRKKVPEGGNEECLSPAVTRSASKFKRRTAGVLEMVTRTPMTRSMLKKKWKRSSPEFLDDASAVEPEGEEEIVIQKRLFQSPEPKKKERKWKVAAEKSEEREKKRKKGTEPGKDKKAATKKSQDSTRVYRKAVVLYQWFVEWPPVMASGSSGDDGKLQLVMTGETETGSVRFVVGKREGPTRFTSVDGKYVSLVGHLDEGSARSVGMPRAAVELLKSGIPSYFQKSLLPFAQKAERPAKHSKPESKATSVKKQSKLGSKRLTPARRSEQAGPALATPPSKIKGGAKFSTSEKTTQEQDRARSSKGAKGKGKKPLPKDSEPDEEEDVWTSEQLDALSDAKLKIPTTESNFWIQVAQFVPGKSAKDCQKKTFAQFRSPPTNRKPVKKAAKQITEKVISTKIARAGSNKFKKQVREFVEEYEKKHVDDLFDTTPSKEGLPELPEFDALKSPVLSTPSRSINEDDSDMDDDAPGLLKKLTARKRDDIDSYVLGINRQHVAGGGEMKGGKVRRVTSMVSPASTAKSKAMSTKKKAVQLVEECGSHFLKGVVSPGGTTHVRVEKDGSSSESEDKDDYHSSDEEEDCDIF